MKHEYDYDEAEQKRRREETIAWREQRRKSTLFMLAASVFEIIETIIIIFVLFIISSLLCFKVFNPENSVVQIAFQASLVVIFLGGIVLGFLVYKKVISLVIRKFKLEDILSKDVVSHYVKKSKDEQTEELKK